MTIVYLKAVVAVGLILAAYFTVAWLNTKRPITPFKRKLPIVLAVLTRLLLFIGVYAIVGASVPSDANGYYYQQAKAAFAGTLWNADFRSSYSPLFPYIAASLLLVNDDPIVFVIMALCLDVIALLFWGKIAGTIDVEETINLSITYAFSAPVILNALVGQQQIWIGACLSVSAWLLISEKRNGAVISGLLQGLILSITKVLAIMFWPVLFAASKYKRAWTVCAIAVPGITFLTFGLLGADLLWGIRFEQKEFTSGNLIYYLDYIVGYGENEAWVYDVLIALSLIAVSLLIFIKVVCVQVQSRANRSEIILVSAALVLATFLLVSKKSYVNYLCFAYFPLLYVLYRGLPRIGYWAACLLLSVGGSLQASLWFARGGNGYWLREWVSGVGWKGALPSIMVEVPLIALYGVMIWLAVRALGGGARMRHAFD
jgi:hypothetical protein